MTAISSLRVAVFGISRSGKDYCIGKTTEALEALGLEIIHFPGVPTISDYSIPILGKLFSDTTKEEKKYLMEVFRRKISGREEIPFLIQDEHYCFPTLYGGKPLVNEYTSAKFPFELKKDPNRSVEYEVMLKEEWIADCDIVFYLRPEPEVVRERMRKSKGAKQNTQITAEDVRSWMEFEIDSLKEICARNGLHFEVLEGNDGAFEKMIRRICGVMGISADAPISMPPKEEYKIASKGTFVGDGVCDEWAPWEMWGCNDPFYLSRFVNDERILDQLSRRNGNNFDLDAMTENDRTEFKKLYQIIKEVVNDNKTTFSRYSIINERIAGESLNSIPTPNQMEKMFGISPIAGILCLGKSMRFLVEEINTINGGLDYSSYSDLLMKLKKGKYIKGKEYDLLQELENQCRSYATKIYADAPEPQMLAKWRGIHSRFLMVVFAPNDGEE